MINNLFSPSDVAGASSDNDGMSDDKEQDESEKVINEQKKEELSGPKLYLLKLIEFNKIEVLEKYGISSATLGGHGDMFEDEQELIEV